MTPIERYDLLVVGSGEGGKFLAWTQAKAGKRVAVIERRWIGGSCPNINCLPSKNEIWSAKVAHLTHHAAKFGTLTGLTTTDMSKVRQRKREMVAGLIAMHLENYKKSGAELILGSARFTGPKTLEVELNENGGKRVLSADQIALNVGTHATIPPIPGLEAAEPLTNIEALELNRLPEHLLVIGGGYVGMELAQAYRRFGSRVTVIHHGPHILDAEDRDITEELQRILRDEGIEIFVQSEPLSVTGKSGAGVILRVRTPQGEKVLQGSDILVAAGRTPNARAIGLELTGVELDERGYIRVNERLETTARGIWALGECAGSPQFTHVSFDDFRVVQDALSNGKRTTRNRLVPFCMFTDPPLARVGVTETEARKRGLAIRVATLPMVSVLRTRTLDETHGSMKVVVSEENDQILGFTMLGPEAGEVVAVVQTAMLAGMPYTGLRDAILTHPTMAEGLNSLMSAVPLAKRKASAA